MAVLGPGLIGGSLLRAVRQRRPEVRLTAWARRSDAVEELRRESGLVDKVSDSVAEAIEGADCIILAMPTNHMGGVVRQMPNFPAGSGVLVTDVGSVKVPVVSEIGPLVKERGGRFLGSHPMAGSEKKGMFYAHSALFEGAAVILTPGLEHESEEGASDLERLKRFWEELGGVVSTMAPEKHDEVVAAVSHLPHLLAAALVRQVLGKTPESAAVSGGGFRDTTRVAGGPEEMWAGILSDNRSAVSKQLGEFIRELETWKEALDVLDSDRLLSFLSEARRLREGL